MGISKQELKILCDYVYKISGIHLDESKDYLLETRLKPILVSNNLNDYTQLINSAINDKTKKLQGKIVDAISTNETFFFRDKTPFDLLRYKIIPDLLDKRYEIYKSKRVPIRILSAACSTGQEVYSIAITLIEQISNIMNYDVNILGIDINDDVVAKASYGKYNKFEVERGMEPGTLRKYFNPVEGGWRINDRVRSMANFKKINLMGNISSLGVFDIIFCRNVAIYFKYNDKVKLFKKLAKMMEPDGYLLVGGSESLSGIAPDFEVNHYLKGIFYSLKPDSQEAAKDVELFRVITPDMKISGNEKTVRKLSKTKKQTKKAAVKPVAKKTAEAISDSTTNILKRIQKKDAEKIPVEVKEKIENNDVPEDQDLNNPDIQIEEINQETVETEQKDDKKITYRQVLNNKNQSVNPLLSSLGNKTATTKSIEYGKKHKPKGDSLLSKLGQ